jgi:hypothetical protein
MGQMDGIIFIEFHASFAANQTTIGRSHSRTPTPLQTREAFRHGHLPDLEPMAASGIVRSIPTEARTAL